MAGRALVHAGRFLADIEKQGEEVHLHDATTPAERAQTEGQIVAAAEKGYGDAEDRRQSLQGRKDGSRIKAQLSAARTRR